MKNIFRIFKRDLKNIFTNWVALVLVIALMCLPAMYAWFNIKACWDPYGNTKGLQVAIVNNDSGYNLGNKKVNVGDEVVDNLKKNDKLGWNFVNEEEGDKGVEDGKYYATIIIPQDFTKNTLSIKSNNIEKPKLIYKVNQKINAIAPKITDKGVNTIKSQVDETIVEAVDGVIFKVLNETGIQVQDAEPTILKLVDGIVDMNDKMPEIDKLVNEAYNGTITAKDLVDKVNKNMPMIKDTLNVGSGFLTNTKTTLENSKNKINEIAPVVKKDLQVVDKTLDFMQSENGVPLIMKFISGINTINNNMPEIQKLVNEAYNGTITTQELIDRINKDIPTIKETLDTSKSLLGDTKTVLENSKQGLVEIAPIVRQDLEVANSTLKSIENVIDSLLNLNANIDKDKDKVIETLDSLTIKITEVKGKVDRTIRLLKPLSNFNPEVKRFVGILNDMSTKLQNGNDFIAKIKDSVINNKVLDKDKLKSLKELVAKNSSIISGILDKYDSEYIPQINKAIDEMTKITDNTLGIVNNAEASIPNVSDLLGKLSVGAELGKDQLAKLKEDFPQIKERMANISSKLNEVNGDELQRLVADNKAIVGEIISKYDTEYIPKINDAIQQLNKIIDNSLIIVKEAQTSMPEVNELLGKLGSGVELGKNELAKLKANMPEIKEKISSIASKVSGVKDEQKINEAIKLLRNDWKTTSSFLASPVEIETQELFNIPNYGSAMSPFYTTLSLWVGALLLVSLLSVDAHPLKEEKELKAYEKYFGKFLTFGFISLFQSLIVSIGDILVLKCYAVNPVKFVAISVFSAMIFLTIVYTLVSIFDNVGKAMAILLLVIQVAGSGGTFPIEVTTPFFQHVYPFLPFTYAISAMRETVGGVVHEVLIKDIVVLIIFGIIALIVGLVFKGPINKASKGLIQKLKESEILGH